MDEARADDIADAPVSLLPGAGPATTDRLAAHGLGTIGALLAAVPRAYDDLRAYTPLDGLAAKQAGAVVLVRGRVARVHLFPRRFLAVTLEAAEGNARVVARWFRAPASMGRAYAKGAEVVLAGPLRFGDGGQPELLHPVNLTARAEEAGAGGLGIRARYGIVPGVAGRVVERIAAAAITRYADRLPDLFGPATRARLGLPAAGEALRALHLPSADATAAELDALVGGTSPAHRRMALEDLLILQVGLARRRRAARAQPGRACAVALETVLADLGSALPFALTRGQARIIADVHRELSAPVPMQRLLVGDVGSGKTVVALAAALQAARAGAQTLLMAPTEILAEQHGRSFTALSARLGLRVGLLTAATPRPQRAALLARAAAGDVDVLVGTQALLSDQLALPALGLAIVDEQHRFGVADRARLRHRGPGEAPGGGPLPHLLVMTATPIPRTLAFTLYGDLDLSVLDELPPGRQRIATLVLDGPSAREAAEQALRATVAAGRRAFVVCPVREQAKRAGAVTAVDRHRSLAATLAPARVGLVHGDMEPAAKEACLRAFRSGALDVLVATTVVEVGIDVPEATLMVVEEADRFGLAQLHQLRGRVGRGASASTCLLVTQAEGSAARERLEALAATNDGFAIAEADLQQRGCGDLFGVRQAGVPRVRFADLAGTARMLELARAEAALILAADPELRLPAHEPLRRAVDARWAAAPIFGEEAG